MFQTDSQFTGSIPETYERYLGPLFFAPYAEDLARRARAFAPRRALEIAAGTGIVTRALAAALPEAEILARDPRGLGEAVEAATRALQREYGDGAIDARARVRVYGGVGRPWRVRRASTSGVACGDRVSRAARR